MRRAAFLFALALVAGVPSIRAQPAPATDAWLQSPEAREFRDRVVLLALIYGDSSGIDPRGLRIVTRRVTETTPGCGRVQVQVFEGERLLLDETGHACRH
jgi:hypothetical protein